MAHDLQSSSAVKRREEDGGGVPLVVRFAAAIAAVAFFGSPPAAQAESAGRRLYSTYCAACHGIDARGNGPVAAALTKAPADLTQLGRRFGVPLPRQRIAEKIDGRFDVLAHGPRDMPVWGKRFQQELAGQPSSEDTTRRTIDVIIDYLVSIQSLQGAMR